MRGKILGPIALFDKSFLQSLNIDESVWFDHFFYPVISPLFYVETLADLEKAVRQGRTPEQEVSFIASKTPELHGGPCVHHNRLCFLNLMGKEIPMNGRIPIAGGRPVKSDGQKGIVIEEAPEYQAFSRWQEGKFLEVERSFAQIWRTSLNTLDLLAVAAGIRAMGIDAKTCKSLEQAKQMANAIINGARPSDCLKLAFLFFEIPHEFENHIIEKWSVTGYPPLSVYAPYAAYVLTVEIFLQIALAANLISTERASNRIDIAYLFYLPFCMLFISSDKLHRRCVPIFLRANQEFVWGENLKADLNQLNEHYLELPECEKEKGIMRFASKPPETGEYLVSKLWDRHFGPWRGKSQESQDRDPEKDKEIVERLNKFSKAPTLPPEEVDFDPDDGDMLSIHRCVRKRKGSWYQLPKDLKISDDD